ncbi:hypothetical protein BGW42_002496, partial [Actinomortierella wolfii]
AADMGCDIKDVSSVVQFRCPETMKISTLVQRLGRAARDNNMRGEAIILTTGKTQPKCESVQRLLTGQQCLRRTINHQFANPTTGGNVYYSRCCSVCEQRKHQENMQVQLSQTPGLPSQTSESPSQSNELMESYVVEDHDGTTGIDTPDLQPLPPHQLPKTEYIFDGAAAEKMKKAKDAILGWREKIFNDDMRLQMPWSVATMVMRDTMAKLVRMILKGHSPEAILSDLHDWIFHPKYGDNLVTSLSCLQRTTSSHSTQKRQKKLANHQEGYQERTWRAHLKKMRLNENIDDGESASSFSRSLRVTASRDYINNKFDGLFSGEDTGTDYGDRNDPDMLSNYNDASDRGNSSDSYDNWSDISNW